MRDSPACYCKFSCNFPRKFETELAFLRRRFKQRTSNISHKTATGVGVWGCVGKVRCERHFMYSKNTRTATATRTEKCIKCVFWIHTWCIWPLFEIRMYTRVPLARTYVYTHIWRGRARSDTCTVKRQSAQNAEKSENALSLFILLLILPLSRWTLDKRFRFAFGEFLLSMSRLNVARFNHRFVFAHSRFKVSLDREREKERKKRKKEKDGSKTEIEFPLVVQIWIN